MRTREIWAIAVFLLSGLPPAARCAAVQASKTASCPWKDIDNAAYRSSITVY